MSVFGVVSGLNGAWRLFPLLQLSELKMYSNNKALRYGLEETLHISLDWSKFSG